MLQKNRGESEILEMKKTYKIRSWEFPRGHTIGKKVEWMSLENRKKVERRRKERLLLYLRKMKQSGYILPVTTK